MGKRGFWVIGVLAWTGCGSSYHASLSNQTVMPDDSTFSLDGAQLHSGIAVAFSPNIQSSDVWGTSNDSSSIVLTSSDQQVVGVAPVPSSGACNSSGSEDSDSNGPCTKWLVWAIAAGSATVTIADGSGNVAASIPVTVTDPPEQ